MTPKIDIAVNLRNLRLAKQLIEIAYNDLKNIKSFREGSDGHLFLMADSYNIISSELLAMIARAEKAAS